MPPPGSTTELPAERALGARTSGGPLEAVAQLHARWATPSVPGHPPLTGGLVGFIGWEAIRQIERLPNVPPADYEIPGQAFSFVSELVVVDHRDRHRAAHSNAALERRH
jgi:anthranilate synthase component 1